MTALSLLVCPSKTSHCDVLDFLFVLYHTKGERSCPLPLVVLAKRGFDVAFLTPFTVLNERDFAVCGRRPKGSALWKLTALKGWRTFLSRRLRRLWVRVLRLCIISCIFSCLYTIFCILTNFFIKLCKNT